MIDKAKLGAVIDSAHGYLDAIDKFCITEYADNNEFELDGLYIVKDDHLGEYEMPLSGNIPSSGRLYFKHNELVSGNITIDDYVVNIKDDKITATKGKYTIQLLTNDQQKARIDGLYNSEYVKDRLIYRGKKPNNWLWLDENGDDKKVDSELYRIISYESDGTIKVVRHNSIGNIAWDAIEDEDDYVLPWDNSTKLSIKTRKKIDSNTRNTYCTTSYGCNVWGTQASTYIGDESLETIDLGKFRYRYYPNANETTTLTPLDGGTVQDRSSLNIILNEYWKNYLSESVNDNIVAHPFYVGGVYPNKKGNDEETQFKRELEEQNTYIWQEADEINKIALVNITDVVESSLNPRCTSVLTNDYNNEDNVDLRINHDWPCKYENGNWLQKKNESDASNYWTLSAYSSTRSGVWNIYSAGCFKGNGTNNTHDVRPSFFLKSDISLIGNGTQNNPYKIISQ